MQLFWKLNDTSNCIKKVAKWVFLLVTYSVALLRSHITFELACPTLQNPSTSFNIVAKEEDKKKKNHILSIDTNSTMEIILCQF